MTDIQTLMVKNTPYRNPTSLITIIVTWDSASQEPAYMGQQCLALNYTPLFYKCVHASSMRDFLTAVRVSHCKRTNTSKLLKKNGVLIKHQMLISAQVYVLNEILISDSTCRSVID